MLSGLITKRLAPLRRVYARQADFMLGVAGIKDFDGIAVCDRYNAPCDVGMGRGDSGEYQSEKECSHDGEFRVFITTGCQPEQRVSPSRMAM